MNWKWVVCEFVEIICDWYLKLSNSCTNLKKFSPFTSTCNSIDRLELLYDSLHVVFMLIDCERIWKSNTNAILQIFKIMTSSPPTYSNYEYLTRFNWTFCKIKTTTSVVNQSEVREHSAIRGGKTTQNVDKICLPPQIQVCGNGSENDYNSLERNKVPPASKSLEKHTKLFLLHEILSQVQTICC